MRQCKYCGSAWVLEGQDKCTTCSALRDLLNKNVARARNVFDRDQLEAALRADRHRYVPILQDLEATDE